MRSSLAKYICLSVGCPSIAALTTDVCRRQSSNEGTEFQREVSRKKISIVALTTDVYRRQNSNEGTEFQREVFARKSLSLH